MSDLDIPHPIGRGRSTSPLRACLPGKGGRVPDRRAGPAWRARPMPHGWSAACGVGDMHIPEQATSPGLWRIATEAGLLATLQAIPSRSTNHV